MSDGDIAQITTVVNQGEIQQAQLARARARNPEVRQFAEHMIQQHQQMLQSQTQLTGRIGVTPSENDTSRRLNLEGQTTMQSLQSQTGDDFDRQYIDAQVRQHQQVLQTLDSQLIPNAQNPQFRQALSDARNMVQQHLDEARRIQQNTGRAGAMNPSAPSHMGGMQQHGMQH
jgi:putative membrane protein